MAKFPPFLDVAPAASLAEARYCLLPLPFEGTVSYGSGTAEGPEAIWRASAQVETWDEELDLELAELPYWTAGAVVPTPAEPAGDYLARVERAAAALHGAGRLVLGVGGEHSLTPPLVRAALAGAGVAGEAMTVVQFDAHADLREEYEGSLYSHASAMRRVLELGCRLIAIGIRSAEREEAAYGRACGRVETWGAQMLALDPEAPRRLAERLRGLSGPVYLTFDIDGLEACLCPATGTPQPGGLGWWQTLGLLKALLLENPSARLIGADLCEVAPQPGTAVNEFVAARLLGKMIAYHQRAGAATA